MIPRYSLPEIADLFTDEARFGAWLEVEVLAVEAWAELGVVPGRRRARRCASGPASTSRRSTSARRSPTTTSPRSSTSCRRRVGQPAGAWVHYGLTSSDVVDTALALQMTRARRPASLDAAADARGGDRGAGARVPRHADGRPHARHPRRAHHVRRQARAVGDAGAPRPRAAARGPATRSRSASCRARSARTRTSIPRSSATCASTSGSQPVPATQVLAARPPRRGAVRVRVGRRERSSRSRSRSGTCSAPRCARPRSRSARASRRARARCRTSATR